MKKPATSTASARHIAVREAIATNRLEGLEVDPDTLQDLEDFRTGKIDLADLRRRVELRFKKIPE